MKIYRYNVNIKINETMEIEADNPSRAKKEMKKWLIEKIQNDIDDLQISVEKIEE